MTTTHTTDEDEQVCISVETAEVALEVIGRVAAETGDDDQGRGVFSAHDDLKEALGYDPRWVIDLRDEVENQATTMLALKQEDGEEFRAPRGTRGHWQGALDNVVDDHSVHADVPEGLSRSEIYDRVERGAWFEAITDSTQYDSRVEMGRYNFPLKVGDRITIDGDLMEYVGEDTGGPSFQLVNETEEVFRTVQMEFAEFEEAWQEEYQ